MTEKELELERSKQKAIDLTNINKSLNDKIDQYRRKVANNNETIYILQTKIEKLTKGL